MMFLLLFWLLASAEASIVVGEDPQLGVESWVTVSSSEQPVAGATVSVIHRPGIAGEIEIAVGITDASGRVRWTPARRGVTTIQAGPRQTTVRVASPLPPPEAITLLGLIIMAGLASLLYGLSVRRS